MGSSILAAAAVEGAEFTVWVMVVIGDDSGRVKVGSLFAFHYRSLLS